MDAKEFRKRGEEIVDYIADYFKSLPERSVSPALSPGFLFPLLPSKAPVKGESFKKIMEDFEKYVMPGITHWHHKRFHAYFPASSSYPSILGEMLSNTFGSVTYNWNISRSAKELESIVLNLHGKMIGLPNEFLYSGIPSSGGGIIRNTCSECLLLSMLTARQNILERLQDKNPSLNPATLLQSLVAYCSKESHSCVEKASALAQVNLKILDTDENYRLRGETFVKAVEEDIKHGLIPFFANITIGNTSCCSCDPIDEIGPTCKMNGIWLNVDAAYGGTALICPEYRHLLEGIEYASTIIVNPVKWMLISFDGAVMWTKYLIKLKNTYSIESDLFHYDLEKHWYQHDKKFQVLKLWCVIRNYGLEGLQKHIRHHVYLAKVFESYVRKDERFKVLNSQFGLVCFRVKGSNLLNKKLLVAINDSSKLHLTPCVLNGKYTIRFCVGSQSATEEDMRYAWSVFCEFATEMLEA